MNPSSKHRSRDPLILGAGISGQGAATLLASRGQSFTISDMRKPEAALVQELTALPVPVHIHSGPDLPEPEDIGRLIVSPGIRPDHPLVQACLQAGLPVGTEVDLALEGFNGPTIGVTGTNGKSTTCIMVAAMLRAAGIKAVACGNLGEPPSAILARDQDPGTLVIELSSYQLHYGPGVSCDHACFTSLSHDHVDWHGSPEAYLRAKWRLVENLGSGGTLVIGGDIIRQATALGLRIPEHVQQEVLTPWNETPTRGEWFLENGCLRQADGPTITDWQDHGLESWHDQWNASMAWLVSRQQTGQSVPDTGDWQPLPWRCQPVGTRAGFPVINDSKSTNLESTLAALRGRPGRWHLLIGGEGKGESFAPLAGLSRQLASIILFGASAGKLADDVRSSAIPLHRFATLQEAMDRIAALTDPDPAGILFSPGCASFDEFANFSERGRFFNAAIAPLLDNS